MRTQRDFLLFVATVTMAATPATAQTPSAAGPVGSETHSAASIPNFSGTWTHPAFPWFEPPASGPGPITNLSRGTRSGPRGPGGSLALPPGKVGISNYDQLVGDYTDSDSAALGGGGGEESGEWRLPASRSEPFEPVLAPANAVHLQADTCR